MPQNTTVVNPGTDVGFQNPAPGNQNLALDSEVVGVDPVSGTQLTREFVVTKESVSGQSADTQMLNLLTQMLIQLKHIRLLLEADQPAEVMEDIPHGEGIVDDEMEETGQGIEEN